MLRFSVSVFFVLLVISCNKPEEKQVQVDKTDVENVEKTLENKKSKGDTISLPAEKLLTYLPSSFDGYTTSEDPELINQNDPGSSWSQATRYYKKGNSKLKISLGDYNGAYGMYTGLSTVFQSDYKVDNDEEMSNVITIMDTFKALESFNKQAKEATLQVGIGERFILMIFADNQENTDYVKTVVDNINIKELNQIQ